MEQEWMENFYELYDGRDIRSFALAAAAKQNGASLRKVS